jgi:putative flippase GtrA
MVKGNAVFIAALITQTIIIVVYFNDVLPYLWLNLLGCVLVMVIAFIIQGFTPNSEVKTVK